MPLLLGLSSRIIAPGSCGEIVIWIIVILVWLLIKNLLTRVVNFWNIAGALNLDWSIIEAILAARRYCLLVLLGVRIRLVHGWLGEVVVEHRCLLLLLDRMMSLLVEGALSDEGVS